MTTMDPSPLAHSSSTLMPQWRFEAKTPERAKVLTLARRVAGSSCPVMILGSTGVGKEVLAQDIHRHSSRANGPFVSVNCAAFTPGLFDSAFFGHLRGSFTGAMRDKPGFVELAHEGTLFLDEVGDLPIEAQAKLLRFLADGTYWPVGATTERRANVRIISATHRPIDAEIGDQFRDDLFFRLSVVLLRIPNLDGKDIDTISRTLLADALGRHGKSLRASDIDDICSSCGGRNWRGGVRELHNVIERFVVLLDIEKNVLDQLDAIMPADRSAAESGPRARRCDSDLMKTVENLLFLVVAQESTDVRHLAKLTDRTVQAVYGRLKKLDLGPEDVGPTPTLKAAIEQLRSSIAPHHTWIKSAILGK